MPNLVVFGDSWVTGEELGQPPGESSPHAFGSQLSKLLGSTSFTNCGIAGSSNSRTVLELLNYTQQMPPESDQMAVFCITTPARSCVISRENKIIDLRSGMNTPLGKTYVEYFSSTKQLDFECFKNILAMQQICQHYKIKDYYIVGWDKVDINFPGIDQSKFYPKTCAELLSNDPRCYTNEYKVDGSHPSIFGHQLIAQALYDFIH